MKTRMKLIYGLLLLTGYLVTGSYYNCMAQNAPVTTVASFNNAIPGQQVVIPVTVTGFNNIGAMTLTMDYDYSKIHFVSYVGNPSLLAALSVGDNDMGNGIHRLVLGWWDGSGTTLSDGSFVVKYTFTYITGEASLQLFDMGPSCQYADANANVLIDTPASDFYIDGVVNGPVQEQIYVNAKVFLEGPFSGGVMTTKLKDAGLLPLTQPYSGSPWNYSTGTEQVVSIPENVTDWVLVELRTQPQATSKVAARVGFITKTGVIIDLDGTAPLNFPGVSNGNYYVVIKHRNHMPVMTAAAITLNAASVLYDFSTGSAKAYGGASGCKQVSASPLLFGMIAGDATNEGSIYINDYTDYWVTSFGLNNVYSRADFKLDGKVLIDDYTDYWVPNFGKSNLLPY